MKKGRAFLALVVILAVLAGLMYVAFHGLGEGRDGSIYSVDLGLDLAGGVSITYAVVGEEEPSATDIADTVEKLRRRVSDYSTEAQVYAEGRNRISIEIPGVSDANQILRELGQPGNLYFIREKDSAGEPNYTMTYVLDALTEDMLTQVMTETTETAELTEVTDGTETVETTEPAEGTETAETTEPAEGTETAETTEPAEGTETTETTEPAEGTETAETTEPAEGTEIDMDLLQQARLAYVLNGKTIEDLRADGAIVLEGADIAGAELGTQQDRYGSNSFVVKLTLTPDGTTKFAEATADAAAKGETIGIYYDGEIISAPKVNEPITDGSAVITGSFTAESAGSLATIIRIGGLKVQLEELRSNVVGAQLGIDAINSSLKAAAVGFGLVVLFMLVVYLLFGLSASVALSFYVSLVIILLDGLEITLTLPGIAGIILSIGMAVDANVLVFSRIREEMAAGKNVRDAMKAGYGKALSAILDGNLTTLIAAVVLMLFGSGPVKGFAYTLTLGIVVSMITALFITRLISYVLYSLGLSDEKLYGRAKEMKRISVVARKKLWYAISLAVIAVGVIAMIAGYAGGRGAFNFSLDFVGGTSTTVTFNEPHTLEDLDATVVPRIREVTGVTNVQTQTVAGSNDVIFKTVTLSTDAREAMSTMLQTEYQVTPEHIATETISATISREMSASATRAMVLALILMLIYIYFRFKDIRFGFSAVLALLHDALIVVACYALTRIEVGSTFIAVVLTIIGYSINNTIVTFDRIRENKANAGRMNQGELIDLSVSQTLTRSLFTSLTTFLMVLALFVFGVTDIRFFALPLMVGVICGTYSSIFIASPLWMDLTRIGKTKT